MAGDDRVCHRYFDSAAARALARARNWSSGALAGTQQFFSIVSIAASRRCRTFLSMSCCPLRRTRRTRDTTITDIRGRTRFRRAPVKATALYPAPRLAGERARTEHGARTGESKCRLHISAADSTAGNRDVRRHRDSKAAERLLRYRNDCCGPTESRRGVLTKAASISLPCPTAIWVWAEKTEAGRRARYAMQGPS